MSPVAGPCFDGAQLLHNYEIAAADYARAVMVLAERSGMMSKTDYTEIRDYSATARAKMEAARNALAAM